MNWETLKKSISEQFHPCEWSWVILDCEVIIASHSQFISTECSMEERALHATKTAGEKWRIPIMQSERVNLSSLLLTSRWFSGMKHKHGSAVSYHGTPHLFASTIPTLALGCFSCPRGFHARSRSEQHDTLHHPGWGIFLEVSRSHVFVLRPQFGKCSNLWTWSDIWVLHDFAI